MYSTLDDLGRALRPLATGRLLKDQGKTELHRWVETGQEGTEYGFCVGRMRGAIGHMGDVPGYNVVAFYLLEQDRSLVGMTNLSNFDSKRGRESFSGWRL